MSNADITLKTHMTREEIEMTMGFLRTQDNIVRLVDPLTELICSTGGVPQEGDLCHTVWGRQLRCENCSSLRALQTRSVLYKMEFVGDRIYWIISRYVNIEGNDCILEIVADTTDSIIIESDAGEEEASASHVGQIIESFNHQLITDPLTGLFNRGYLEDIFLPTLDFRRRHGMTVNLAVLDLDRFKQVNDTYGHKAGDLMLADVSGFWRRQFNSRAKNRERLAIRYGGDEMLLIDCSRTPEEFEERVRNSYAKMRKTCFVTEHIELPFTRSIGIASSDELGEDWTWEQLFELADTRMYEEKELHHQHYIATHPEETDAEN